MAVRKKYKKILLGDIVVPKESATLTMDAAKNACKANEKAYSDLILSCNDEVSFGIIKGSTTSDNPSGDARLAWKELSDKCNPDTGITKTQIKKEFAISKLQGGQAPDEWIRSLEQITSKLKSFNIKVDQDDLFIHILNNLTKEDEPTV